jgi:unsaturated chondroitin disaccharide hydrolase
VIQFEFESDRTLLEDAFRYAQQQVRALVEKYPDYTPMYTENGQWNREGPAWTHWCDGFLPGMMWIFHRHLGPAGSDSEWWREKAIRYTQSLEPRKNDRDVHDLGFIFLCTYFRWYQLTQDAELNEVLVQAGQTLAMRFQEKGQYLRSFVGDESLFIDIVMNVGLIFHAARETGDRMLRDIALRHSLTTRRYLIRGDGSTAHEGIFDTDTGEFLRQSTHQGYRGDSCWSRGLSWALYGFSNVYEYSRDPRFLDTAQGCADYYISHSPSDGVPCAAVGFPGDRGQPQTPRHVRRGHSGSRPVEAMQVDLRPDERAPVLDGRAAHPPLTLRKASRSRYARLGRSSQERGVSLSQGDRRRRVGNLGGLLLCRSAGFSAPATDVDGLCYCGVVGVVVVLDRMSLSLVPITSPDTTSSTRRFCCRPAAVSLPTAGIVSPNPFAVTDVEGTPCETRYSRTESARCSESRWLYASPPTLSVWPSTSIRRPG